MTREEALDAAWEAKRDIDKQIAAAGAPAQLAMSEDDVEALANCIYERGGSMTGSRIITDYAVKTEDGEILATGLRNPAARLLAQSETLARLDDIERDYPDGFTTAAACEAALRAAICFVTPENLS